ncbi:P-II family nitrogen regulator, partial [Achromobacter ruhlandii]
MKLLIVIIKPFHLYQVRVALSGIGGQGLPITARQGSGRPKGNTALCHGAE